MLAEGDGVLGVPITGVTLIFIVLEIAGLPVAHVKLDVSTQVTASLSTGV